MSTSGLRHHYFGSLTTEVLRIQVKNKNTCQRCYNVIINLQREGGDPMREPRIVLKSDIRKWLRRAVAFFSACFVGTAVLGLAMVARSASCAVCRRFVTFMGALAATLCIAAATAGVRCASKYVLYRRYFEMTGLTKCSEENIKRWKATRDITQ